MAGCRISLFHLQVPFTFSKFVVTWRFKSLFFHAFYSRHHLLVRICTNWYFLIPFSYTANRVVHIKRFVIDVCALQIPLKRHEAGESFDVAYRVPAGTDRLLDSCP